VQINTAVRPPAESDVGVPSEERLQEIRSILGPRAEIIAPVAELQPTAETRSQRRQVLEMLRRRPCTAAQVADGLGANMHEVLKHLRALLAEGKVRRRQQLYETYYEAAAEE
jgi:DNA-binding transcriptional ArsR family regulator